MEKREQIIRRWFTMWLQKEDLGIGDIFDADVHYIESWGPQYRGAEQVRHWFNEWNGRGTVMQWDIKAFFHKEDTTLVTWYFRNTVDGGRVEAFDGVTLVEWTAEDKICLLQEFGCNENRYDPYAKGPEPHFQDEQPLWF